MTIAFLGFTKIKYMPYLHFYLNQIDLSKNDVHLIYWDRDENDDSPVPDGIIAHSFSCNMSDAIPLRKKIPCLIKYRKFAKKALRELNPDFLVVLHSTTGITILDVLKRKYKNRYILDYRDVTYERNKLYRKAVASLVRNAAVSFTSSDGFRTFLPTDAEILTSHNLTRDVLVNREQYLNKEKSEKIRIAFWGLVRNIAVNESLIKALGNDERFELHYYGRAQGRMLELMEESVQKYNNVFFHGEYKPKDRMDFAKRTDMLHNLYDKGNKTSHIAIGNKYYDSAIFYIPQLCMIDSFMAKLSTRAHIGFACDPSSDTFADEVFNYYASLDRNAFINACDTELERVLQEVDAGEKRIREVFERAEEH